MGSGSRPLLGFACLSETITITEEKFSKSLRLGWLPGLTVLALMGPVLAGLAGTLAPAFGWLPGLDEVRFSLDPFRALFGWPGFAAAARLSVTTGLGATVLSVVLVIAICAGWAGSPMFRWLERMLSPLLAVPHAAAAFGLAFLIAPSGWIARLVSPGMSGWHRPPDLLIVQDLWGFAMMAGLVAKEVPFLLLMTLAALGQADASRSLTVARALGYCQVTAWLKGVFPRIYCQIRLPVYVVLAYSMSVVDVAVILGPNTPPTLSVQITRWMSDPDLAFRLQGAAGAVIQFALVLGAMAVWWLGEKTVARLGRRWVRRGRRGQADRFIKWFGLVAAVLSASVIILGLLGLAIWSFAGFWHFPDILPDGFTLRSWNRHLPGIWSATGETVKLAGTATVIALFLVIGCLEAEHRHGLKLSHRGIFLLYLPLIIPQIAFLPGLQTLLLITGAETGRVPVVAVHLVFVLPYVFLSLADPFQAWEPRFGTIGAALGAGADRILWRIRLPMLITPILTAFAVGFAVSVGQYLPTLLVGGGRVSTLTTEAVALAAGGDRRTIGVYGLAQTFAAFLPFAVALLLPAMLWRNKKGMRDV